MSNRMIVNDINVRCHRTFDEGANGILHLRYDVLWIRACADDFCTGLFGRGLITGVVFGRVPRLPVVGLMMRTFNDALDGLVISHLHLPLCRSTPPSERPYR